MGLLCLLMPEDTFLLGATHLMLQLSLDRRKKDIIRAG